MKSRAGGRGDFARTGPPTNCGCCARWLPRLLVYRLLHLWEFKMSKNRNSRSAFTLIELLLVMVILIILASIIVPNLANQSIRARITKAKTDINVLQTALSSFQIDCGRLPTNEEG